VLFSLSSHSMAGLLRHPDNLGMAPQPLLAQGSPGSRHDPQQLFHSASFLRVRVRQGATPLQFRPPYTTPRPAVKRTAACGWQCCFAPQQVKKNHRLYVEEDLLVRTMKRKKPVMRPRLPLPTSGHPTR